MISSRILTGTILAGAVLGLSACGGSDSADLGDSTDSGIQNVPVPEAAEENTNLDGAWTVPNEDVEAVVSWYENQLPIGEPYEGLEFCETQEDGEFISWLWWEPAPEGHDGTPWLTVRVTGGESTGIMIDYAEDDPSQCASA